MFRRSLIIFIILIFANCSQSWAAKASKPNRCTGWFTNLRSPLCSDAKYIFWTGAFISAGLYFTRSRTGDRISIQARTKRPLGNEWPEVGDAVGAGWLNGAYILHQMIWGDKNGGKNAELMVEASAYTAAVTLLLKEYVSEPRPGAADDKTSFPSGHASLNFAFASVVAARHNIFSGTLAYLLASYIAYTRVHDDYHNFHDIIAGATIGMSYGWGIHWNHVDSKHPYWFGVLPTDDLQGLKVAYSFQF